MYHGNAVWSELMSAFFNKGTIGPLSAIAIILIAGALLLLRSFDAEKQLYAADAAYQRGEYKEADVAYHNASNGLRFLVPETRSKVLVGLGRCAFARGDIEQSRQLLKEALQSARDSDEDMLIVEVQNELGDQCQLMHDLPGAVAAYSAAQAVMKPETPDHWSLIYKLIVKNARAAAPDSPEQIALLRRADEVYAKHLQIHADDAGLAFARAYANYLRSRNLAQFQSDCRQALTLAETPKERQNPLTAEILIESGRTYELDPEQQKMAEDFYKRAYTLRRNLFGLDHFLTAEAEFLAGKQTAGQEGDRLMREAILTQERWLPTLHNTDDVIDNIAVAVADAEISPDPHAVDFWYDKAAVIMKQSGCSALYPGALYYFRGRYDKSEPLLKEALDRATSIRTRAHVCFMLGAIAVQKREADAASRYFDQGLNLVLTTPDRTASKDAMEKYFDPANVLDAVSFFLHRGNWSRAQQIVDQWANLNQKKIDSKTGADLYSNDLRYARSLIQTATGEFEKAQYTLSLCLKQDPGDRRAIRARAVVSAMEGEFDLLKKYVDGNKKGRTAAPIEMILDMCYHGLIARHANQVAAARAEYISAIDRCTERGLADGLFAVRVKSNLANVELNDGKATRLYFDVSKSLDQMKLQTGIDAVIAENNCAKFLLSSDSKLAEQLLDHADQSLQRSNAQHPFRICVLRNLVAALKANGKANEASDKLRLLDTISGAYKELNLTQMFAGDLIDNIPFGLENERPVNATAPSLMEWNRFCENF